MEKINLDQLNKKSNYIDRVSTKARSPKGVFFVSREEFYEDPLELIVHERVTESNHSSDNFFLEQDWKPGSLPADLHGHIFMVGSAGYFGSSSLKDEQNPHIVKAVDNHDNDTRNSLINGEGMIYRLDFHETSNKSEDGKAWLATRIMKTPDHYADKALWQDGDDNKYKKRWPKEYPQLRFYNFYLCRASIKMGNRNYLNTAFLPMKFNDGSERLLATWDVGRPYEIDPRTLGLCAPIGWNSQWHPMLPVVQNTLKNIFPLTLTSAHPVFDTHTNEMFTVNVSKSLRNFFCLSRILNFNKHKLSDSSFKLPLLKKKIFDRLIKSFVEWFSLLDFKSTDAVHLKRWMGEGTSVEDWEVLTEDGKSLSIRQTIHQMGISEDYILLADSAFKLVLRNILPDSMIKYLANHKIGKYLKSINKYLSYPQLPYTKLYIIKRSELKTGTKTVTAKEVTIAPETAHFLVDYANPDGKIILHVGHTPATDPAEFIRSDDQSVYDNIQTEELKARAGMFLSPMDVSRIGSWIIDPDEETCEPVFMSDKLSLQHLWAISMYAWQGFQPQQFTDIYWNCWGGWSELMSDYMVDLYKNYENRLVPVDEVIDTVKKGKPANLLRMHIERKDSIPTELTIADVYNFPPGYLGNSPQFVSRRGTDDPTEGYIVCVVIHSNNGITDKSEIWIFDAKNLSNGPRYRLIHPHLNIGVTIHTTWLSKLENPPERKDYCVRSDYQDTVEKTKSEAIKTLFEEDVYPHFEYHKT